MRIISGLARGTILVAPAGVATRPTSDMAKESLFNIINMRIRCAQVLDLFCGSGAIGIEAISRGAAHATFVDVAKPAMDATVHNLQKTKLATQATFLQLTAAQAVKRLCASGSLFDVIFLDPPYDTPLLNSTLPLLVQLLAPGGIVIAETDKAQHTAAPVVKPLNLQDTRVYGRTCFLFYTL